MDLGCADLSPRLLSLLLLTILSFLSSSVRFCQFAFVETGEELSACDCQHSRKALSKERAYLLASSSNVTSGICSRLNRFFAAMAE